MGKQLVKQGKHSQTALFNRQFWRAFFFFFLIIIVTWCLFCLYISLPIGLSIKNHVWIFYFVTFSESVATVIFFLFCNRKKIQKIMCLPIYTSHTPRSSIRNKSFQKYQLNIFKHFSTGSFLDSFLNIGRQSNLAIFPRWRLTVLHSEIMDFVHTIRWCSKLIQKWRGGILCLMVWRKVEEQILVVCYAIKLWFWGSVSQTSEYHVRFPEGEKYISSSPLWFYFYFCFLNMYFSITWVICGRASFLS